MTIVVASLIAVAIIWPKGVGRWFAEIINAYEAARRALEGGKDAK